MFLSLRCLEAFSYQCGAELNAISWHQEPNRQATRDVLIRLHAHSCRVFSEILTLLEAGYADGAHARWRSLHEVAVIALFLQKHGDQAATLYREHEAVDAWHGAKEYEKVAAKIKHEPLGPETMGQLKSRYDAAIARHGPSFKTTYGWAAVLLKVSRPGLRELETAVGVEHLRSFYMWASQQVHAPAKAFTSCLGTLPGQPKFMLAGASNVGLLDPAQSAAISLSQVLAALLLELETVDAPVCSQLAGRLVDLVKYEGLSAHDSIEGRHHEEWFIVKGAAGGSQRN
ncbi:MAG TPA: DUF5677 domain-containing protein [Phycisphaerales bacterium]